MIAAINVVDISRDNKPQKLLLKPQQCITVMLKLILFYLTQILLSSCILGSASSLSSSTPLDQWVLALEQQDYDTARKLMVDEDFAAWQAETATLFRQHQAVQAYTRFDESVLPDQNPVIRTQWTWKDGFVNCLRLRVAPDGKIDLLDTSYQDCTALIQLPASELPMMPSPKP